MMNGEVNGEKKTSIQTPAVNPQISDDELRRPHLQTSYLISDGSDFRIAREAPSDHPRPAIRQDIETVDGYQNVVMDRIIDEFTLNAEQTRAFKIVAQHSLIDRPEALRMDLGGPGGTGKSRVINALKVFFERRNQSRRFRLASYTGVAAKNISGMTLHAALSLNQRLQSGARGKTRRDLIAMWEGVDYLIIDEVSMIGCRFLLRISEALTEAKQSTSAFGGINVIFAGDFAQLPPVGKNRLFAHINTANVNTKKGQENVFGKLLWLSVKTVVILTEVWRQAGPENQTFVSLLNRLRHGMCDFEMLNSRIISNAKSAMTDDTWKSLPIIVSDNAVKDALNAKATEAFARRTGREMHWYYATDKRGGNRRSRTQV